MKIQVFVSTNKVGSRTEETIEVDDSDLAICDTQEERDRMIDEVAYDFVLSNMIEWGWIEK